MKFIPKLLPAVPIKRLVSNDALTAFKAAGAHVREVLMIVVPNGLSLALKANIEIVLNGFRVRNTHRTWAVIVADVKLQAVDDGIDGNLGLRAGALDRWGSRR